MCNLKILNRTSNGLLFYCNKNDTYNLSFKNLTFNFTSSEMFSFSSFLQKINCDYWEKEYENSVYEKKIPIPTLQSNFIILLDKKELTELKILINYKKHQQLLKCKEINYNLVYN